MQDQLDPSLGVPIAIILWITVYIVHRHQKRKEENE